MLDPSQHGFCAKHGTDSASLLLVDALEHVKETHTACLVSSWDIRRAFDSISKPALQMAWTRLGVPRNGPSSSYSLISMEPQRSDYPSHNMHTTTKDSPASTASKLWEPQTFSFQPPEVSHKGTSQAHSAGMPYTTSFSGH